jgi:hypothetical protein
VRHTSFVHENDINSCGIIQCSKTLLSQMAGEKQRLSSIYRGKCVVEIDTDPGTSGRAIEESTTYVFCIAKPREVDWTDLKRFEAKDLGFYPARIGPWDAWGPSRFQICECDARIARWLEPWQGPAAIFSQETPHLCISEGGQLE